MKRRSFLKGLIGVSLVGVVSKEVVAAASLIPENSKSKVPTSLKKRDESAQATCIYDGKTMRLYDGKGVLRMQSGILD